MQIKYMSNSEQFTQPFPVDDNIIVKLPQGTRVYLTKNSHYLFDANNSTLYNTANELIKKLEHSVLNSSIGPDTVFKQGIKVEILEPGKQWTAGKFRCRLVFEFIPDEQENNTTASGSASPLDDLRKMNL